MRDLQVSTVSEESEGLMAPSLLEMLQRFIAKLDAEGRDPVTITHVGVGYGEDHYYVVVHAARA